MGYRWRAIVGCSLLWRLKGPSFSGTRILWVLSDVGILAEREKALDFLNRNERRVEASGFVDLVELRPTISGLRTHVAVEYMWLYAMRYHVNIYLLQALVVNNKTLQEMLSTFSIRLFTPEKVSGNRAPIASDHPNTIAIYLHNIRDHEDKDKVSSQKEKQAIKADNNESISAHRVSNNGLGHFEYLVDPHTRASCWRTRRCCRAKHPSTCFGGGVSHRISQLLHSPVVGVTQPAHHR